jgi:hypothetical protein
MLVLRAGGAMSMPAKLEKLVADEGVVSVASMGNSLN